MLLLFRFQIATIPSVTLLIIKTVLLSKFSVSRLTLHLSHTPLAKLNMFSQLFKHVYSKKALYRILAILRFGLLYKIPKCSANSKVL